MCQCQSQCCCRDEDPRERRAEQRKVLVNVRDDEGEDGDDERAYEKAGEE